MSSYTFRATIIQSLDRVYSLATKKELHPALCLEISFRYVYYKVYNDWDNRPDGDIVIDKLVDWLTQTRLYLHELTFIAQLDIRCRCFDYLRANHLLRYSNVFPFQSVPYRYSSHSDDKTHTAEVIDFPRR